MAHGNVKVIHLWMWTVRALKENIISCRQNTGGCICIMTNLNTIRASCTLHFCSTRVSYLRKALCHLIIAFQSDQSAVAVCTAVIYDLLYLVIVGQISLNANVTQHGVNKIFILLGITCINPHMCQIKHISLTVAWIMLCNAWLVYMFLSFNHDMNPQLVSAQFWRDTEFRVSDCELLGWTSVTADDVW